VSRSFPVGEVPARAESYRASWRWRLLVAVVAGLVVVTGVVSVASASARGAGDDKGRTLRLRTTVVSSSVNDAGHGGVADVTALLFSMQRSDGSTAGQGWVSCVNILATDQLCHAAFVLSGGQIQAQAEIRMAAALSFLCVAACLSPSVTKGASLALSISDRALISVRQGGWSSPRVPLPSSARPR
jgi:hypothetical protein